jgi:hypothetical protein
MVVTWEVDTREGFEAWKHRLSQAGNARLMRN